LWTKFSGVLERMERLMDALLSFQHKLNLNPRHRQSRRPRGTLCWPRSTEWVIADLWKAAGAGLIGRPSGAAPPLP
jgi:hypothetical protein